jgi:hypothetical protein
VRHESPLSSSSCGSAGFAQYAQIASAVNSRTILNFPFCRPSKARSACSRVAKLQIKKPRLSQSVNAGSF